MCKHKKTLKAKSLKAKTLKAKALKAKTLKAKSFVATIRIFGCQSGLRSKYFTLPVKYR